MVSRLVLPHASRPSHWPPAYLFVGSRCRNWNGVWLRINPSLQVINGGERRRKRSFEHSLQAPRLLERLLRDRSRDKSGNTDDEPELQRLTDEFRGSPRRAFPV